MDRMCVLCATLLLAMAGSALADDGCAICHEDPKFRVQHRALWDYAMAFEKSVHAEAGLSCGDCHGGNEAGADFDAIHDGVLDPVRYDRIAGTCGDCHSEQHNAFVTSRHSKILADDGLAPNCVTCHGAMDMRTIAVVEVRAACLECHLPGSEVAPNVPAKADDVLRLVNNIKGYRRYVTKYSQDEAFKAAVEKRYAKLTESWHRFDLVDVGPEATTLLTDLRAEKDRIITARRQR